MNWLDFIGFAPLIVMLAVAAVIDVRQRRIPNWLTFSLLAAGIGRAIAFGSAGSVENALLGMLAGGLIPLVLYALSALGGGDVKLLAAIGAWMGPGPILMVMMIEAVLGMVIVLVQAITQRRTGALLRNSAIIAAGFAGVSETGLRNAVETGKACRSVSRPLPFAVPVFVATAIVLSISKFVGR